MSLIFHEKGIEKCLRWHLFSGVCSEKMSSAYDTKAMNETKRDGKSYRCGSQIFSEHFDFRRGLAKLSRVVWCQWLTKCLLESFFLRFQQQEIRLPPPLSCVCERKNKFLSAEQTSLRDFPLDEAFFTMKMFALMSPSRGRFSNKMHKDASVGCRL